MAYSIERTNGQTIAVVEDGTVDNTTDLKFIGKNYAGYGEIQNENFLKLLESFSSANQPPRPLSGQVWYDSGNNKLKFFDGTIWRTTGGSEVSATQPTGLTVGDFWWDTANEQLYAFNGTSWILVGPQDAGENVTQMQSRTVREAGTGIQKPVIVSLVDDTVVHIISPEEFQIDTTDPENTIPGFDIIRKGITLINTQDSTNGVTSDSSRFYGTATNAEKLNGFEASDFVQISSGTATSFSDGLNVVNDSGISIGESDDFQLRVTGNDGDEAEIVNTIGEEIRFKVTTSETEIVTVDPIGAHPGTDSQYDLGKENLKWDTVYATRFEGIASVSEGIFTADSQLPDPENPGTVNYLEGRVAAEPSTLAARDSNGNLAANIFTGTATRARYADLAENYTVEKNHPVGTVMAVCSHGDHETCPAKSSDFAIGVISENPAYLMNESCGGQAIALKGRVPVRVAGPVQKGQAVYAWENGVASTITTNGLVGIALETNTLSEEKMVECVLKV